MYSIRHLPFPFLHLFVGQSPIGKRSGGNLVYWANFSQKWNCICFAWKTIITLASACAMQEFQFIQLWKYFMWANKNISFIEFPQDPCACSCSCASAEGVLGWVDRVRPQNFCSQSAVAEGQVPSCHQVPLFGQVEDKLISGINEPRSLVIWYMQSRATRKTFYLLRLSCSDTE